MKALIIEDDALAADLLCAHLARSKEIEVIACLGEFSAAAKALADLSYDVVFLDVQLIGGSGLDLVSLVRPTANVIFVTGRDDHAIRAFEANAVDYIVKPVTAKRLDAALARLGQQERAPGNGRYAPTAVVVEGRDSAAQSIELLDIIAIVAMGNYTEVFLFKTPRIVVRRTMRAWLQMLPDDTFVRVHRTAMVNLRFVSRVDRATDGAVSVIMREVDRAIPLSRRIWPELRRRMAIFQATIRR